MNIRTRLKYTKKDFLGVLLCLQLDSDKAAKNDAVFLTNLSH